MVKRVLWLVDDSLSPFWKRDGQFVPAVQQHFPDYREVHGFDHWRDAVGKIEKIHADRSASTDTEHFLVSDVMFKGEDKGGNHLVEFLLSTEAPVTCTRAVLYSSIANSQFDKPGKLLCVTTTERPLLDINRICRFLIDGQEDQIGMLAHRIDLLRPVAFLCDALAKLDFHEPSNVFPPMTAYGIAAPKAQQRYVFDLALFPTSPLATLFAVESAELFSQGCSEAFMRGYRYFKEPQRVDLAAAWSAVLSGLSPWETLVGPPSRLALPAIRVIYEALQTGSDPALLRLHPYFQSSLSAYERVWLRGRLTEMELALTALSRWPAIRESCERFVAEFEVLQALVRDASSGQEEIDAGDL